MSKNVQGRPVVSAKMWGEGEAQVHLVGTMQPVMRPPGESQT